MTQPTYRVGEQVTYRQDAWNKNTPRPMGVVWRASDQYDEWVHVAWPDGADDVHKNNLIRWEFKHLG